MHKFVIDQITGKFDSSIAEFWFAFAGYILIASAFHAAADLGNNVPLSIVKWVSYIALYFWLKYQTEKAFYYIWPNLEVKHGVEKQAKAKDWQFILANAIAPVITFIGYGVGYELSNILSSIKP